jgi:predicted rRNA methylase YqxC with S4 and FtsJ domains
VALGRSCKRDSQSKTENKILRLNVGVVKLYLCARHASKIQLNSELSTENKSQIWCSQSQLKLKQYIYKVLSTVKTKSYTKNRK